tara:strand:+ start:61 stop:1482 length:1422 start_codon:yes stop_codon:yes gene_type:complete
MEEQNNNCDLIVIGAGPGGYTAAFRAADLGLSVTLIDKNSYLGGVCLNEGCIPSKSLLHIAKIINDSKEASKFGVSFNKPIIDVKKIQDWKNNVIKNLNQGIEKLASFRKINVINGHANFKSATQIEVTDSQNKKINLNFKNCIIATGSKPHILNHLNKQHPSIINSTDALNFNKIPNRILIIGGGYIGLELGTVFASLGSKITVAEYLPSLLSMADQDLVKPLSKVLNENFENIYLSTEVTSLIPQNNDKVVASFKQKENNFKDSFDLVLFSTGRVPNTDNISIEKTGIRLDEKGFIPVNNQRRTLIPNIFAIGDITGDPMLAHKATHEAKVAAEAIAERNSSFNPTVIPSVIYTNPEIAWVGLNEKDLKEQKIKYVKAEFPWNASGRAMSVNGTNGLTKILSSPEKDKILGIGIVGENAGELISEAILAIEMNCIPEDIALTIHPHPTLSETLANAAEILNGTITDLYIPK